MFDLFGSLKNILKVNEIHIDNAAFRLHYKVTTILLFGCSVLVTSKQYIGDPIDCITSGKDDIPNNVLDTFCWIHSTYTLPDALNKKIGEEVPHPGIKHALPEDKRIYHAYYQWVCFMLFFQAIFFYIPHYLWKTMEKGTLKNIILELNNPITDKSVDKVTLLASYLKTTFGSHNIYAYKFFFCEALNFANVVGQIYFMDLFLGGEFTTYGTEVIKFTETVQELRVDPMIKIFPRVTKCTFHKYGPAGGIQTHDTLCVLPINIINEKIYVFMWFLFVILSVISGLMVLFRLALLCSLALQRTIFIRRYQQFEPYKIRSVLEKGSIGDWLLLSRLAVNMDPIHFRETIAKLSGMIDSRTQDEKSLRNDDKQIYSV